MSQKLPRIMILLMALAVGGAVGWSVRGTAGFGAAALLFASGMLAAFAVVSLMRLERRERRRAVGQPSGGGGERVERGDRDEGGRRGRGRGKGRGGQGQTQGQAGRDRSQSGRARGRGQRGPSKPSRKAGSVKWFDGAKGYGFITPDDGEEDCFVHRSSVKDGQALAEGERVEFHVIIDDRGRKAAADVVSI